MRISPISSKSFKGLWEVKTSSVSTRPEGTCTKKTAVYHPFKKEHIQLGILREVPTGFKSEDGKEMILTDGEFGRRLHQTEAEFYLMGNIPLGMCTTASLSNIISNNDRNMVLIDKKESAVIQNLFSQSQ